MHSTIDLRVQKLLAPVERLGRRGKRLEQVMPLLLQRELLLAAYARIAQNRGATTPGVDGETAEGMSIAGLDAILDRLRGERYVWGPLRAVQIPKEGKPGTRTLLIPCWADRVVHEAMRLVLSAYYEPRLSPRSYGFRPGIEATAAIAAATSSWPTPAWFVETDIASCFDTIEHHGLLGTLGEGIADRRFLSLLAASLRSGQMHGRRWNRMDTGVPQGSPLSPLLANIYLHRLDRFVEQDLLKSRALTRIQVTLPFGRDRSRAEYARYVDDVLLGVSGSREDAEDLLGRLRGFVETELRLHLAPDKTRVVDARRGVRFLGYDLALPRRPTRDGASAGLRASLPGEVIDEYCDRFARNGKPRVRTDLRASTPRELIGLFRSEFGTFQAYYRYAANASDAVRLQKAIEASLVATLAARFDLTPPLIYREYGSRGGKGQRGTLLGLAGQRAETAPGSTTVKGGARSSRPRAKRRAAVRGVRLAERLDAGMCEACGTVGHVEAHQSRGAKALPFSLGYASLGAIGAPVRVRLLCAPCHEALHKGQRLTFRGAKRQHAPEPKVEDRSSIWRIARVVRGRHGVRGGGRR